MRRAAEAVISWEWLILLLLLPFLLFPTGWRALLLLIIPLLWITRKIGTGRFVPDTPFDNVVLVLMTALLISLAAVFNIEYSFPKIAGLILGIAVFYGAVQYSRDIIGGEYHLLALILVAGSGMVTVGLLGSLNSLDYLFLSPLIAWLPGAALLDILGAEVNPNELAGVLAWLLPLFMAVTVGFFGAAWRSDRWSLKFLWLVLAVLLLVNSAFLVVSQSRGGIFSVLIAIAIMLAIRFRWGRWFLLLLVIGTILLEFFFDLGDLLVGGGQALAEFGLQGRLEIWSRAFYAIADFPFTGLGMNGFRQAVHILYPMFTISPTFDLGHAHNHLLQSGLDLGILGLVAYISIWLLCAAVLWIGWSKLNRHADRVLIVGLSGSMAAGWFFGIFDAIALGAKPGFLWWLLIALLVAAFDNIRHHHSPEQI